MAQRTAISDMILPAPGKEDDEKILHLILEEHHLLAIHKAFLEEESGQFDQKQLEMLLFDIAHLRFDQKNFEIMFLKMNTKR